MTIKCLGNHVVQTDEDYIIKSEDRVILVVPTPSGLKSDGFKVHLRLPRCAHRGHKLTIVATDVDVIVTASERG